MPVAPELPEEILRGLAEEGGTCAIRKSWGVEGRLEDRCNIATLNRHISISPFKHSFQFFEISAQKIIYPILPKHKATVKEVAFCSVSYFASEQLAAKSLNGLAY